MSDSRVLALREGYMAEDRQTTRAAAKWGYTLIDSNGVGVVAVEDSLSDGFSFFGGTSYTSLRMSIEALMNDDKCKSVAVLFNSPGGEVSGLFECAAYIREAAKRKPVCAHVTGMCCSAAYALAAACGKVYATETSEIGSVGVMAQAVDFSEYQKKQGILARIFRSKNAENKNASAFTEDGAKDLQAKVDYFEDCFYGLLSECRGKDREKCVEDFGHGSVFLASEALERGMIDGILGYDALMDSIASSDKEEEEEEDMDISKMSAEEKLSVFNALVADDPSLLAKAEGEASARERERIAELEAERTDVTAEIIDGAIAEGKSVSDIAMELYRAQKGKAEKLEAENPMALIEKQAEAVQEINAPTPTPDDIRARAEEVAKTVTKARK